LVIRASSQVGNVLKVTQGFLQRQSLDLFLKSKRRYYLRIILLEWAVPTYSKGLAWLKFMLNKDQGKAK
jgi:hypothetical protein